MFPVEIGLRDPRSQKRDLGHPSISPFDIAEGTSFVISLPTRFSESAARYDMTVVGPLLKAEDSLERVSTDTVSVSLHPLRVSVSRH